MSLKNFKVKPCKKYKKLILQLQLENKLNPIMKMINCSQTCEKNSIVILLKSKAMTKNFLGSIRRQLKFSKKQGILRGFKEI